MQWREVQLQPGSTGTMQRPVLWSKGHLTLWRPVGDQYFSRLWKCTRLLQWRSLLQSQRWRHSWACGRGSVGNSCVGSWTTLLQLFMSMTTIKEMCERQNSFIRSHKSFGSRFIPCKWSYYFLFSFSQLSFQINLTASPPWLWSVTLWLRWHWLRGRRFRNGKEWMRHGGWIDCRPSIASMRENHFHVDVFYSCGLIRQSILSWIQLSHCSQFFNHYHWICCPLLFTQYPPFQRLASFL